jgi:nucleotide-binding universal stress UspA family protein
MVTRILVPVDYSERSREALRYAAMLAAKLCAELTILHAWDCPPFARTTEVVTAPGARAPLDQLVVDAARHELQAFVSSAALDPGLKQKLVLSPLHPVRAVIGAVESGEHDLIVMGTHGRGATLTLLLGSVAQRVVESSPVPVVLVPDTAARRRALSEGKFP